jgi:iron complex transport system substrate-binding protein
MAATRIVSLVPSATETVFRLGAGDSLVGRSHACDFPAEAQSRPVLTRPRLSQTSSRGIHDELRSLLSGGLAIYDLDLDGLRALAPTHLLVQDQCSVCAVSPADLEAALAEWLGTPPELVQLAPSQLHDVWRDLAAIGDAIGRSAEATRLRHVLADDLTNIVEGLGALPGRPRVACIEWLEPLMIAGHWIPELVRIAGGEPLLNHTGAPSRTIDCAELLAASPEVIVLQVCGFDLEASRRAWDAWPELRKALAELPDDRPRVFLTDGDAFFNRPGPRLVESTKILAAILHPSIDTPKQREQDFQEIGVAD